MILHAASIATLFFQQAPQPQCVMNCATSSGQDPIFSRLLFDAVPSIFALGIAWLVFRWNGRRYHERWVLDQKKAEWKELLIKVAAIEEIIPSIVTGLTDYPELEPAVRAILPLLRGNIFIYQTIKSNGFIGRWESFLQDVSGEFEMTIKGDNLMQNGLLPEPMTWDDRERSEQRRRAAELEIRQKLHNLREELRSLAHKELKI